MKNLAITLLAILSLALAIMVMFCVNRISNLREENRTLVKWVENFTASRDMASIARDFVDNESISKSSATIQKVDVREPNSLRFSGFNEANSSEAEQNSTSVASITPVSRRGRSNPDVASSFSTLAGSSDSPAVIAKNGRTSIQSQSAGKVNNAASGENHTQSADSNDSSAQNDSARASNPTEPTDTIPQPVFPRATWSFSGFSSPESAFQSVVWAANANDPTALLRGIDPSEMDQLKRSPESPDSESLARLTDMFSNVGSFHVLRSDRIAEDQSTLTVDLADNAGQSETKFFALRRDKFGWRFAGLYSPR